MSEDNKPVIDASWIERLPWWSYLLCIIALFYLLEWVGFVHEGTGSGCGIVFLCYAVVRVLFGNPEPVSTDEILAAGYRHNWTTLGFKKIK